jgi:hypothetical protein
MGAELLAQVEAYIAAASAAGVIGGTAYEAVRRLVAWTTDELGSRPVALELTADQTALLASLFAAAQAEWSPAISQSISIGGPNTGVAINAANSSVST